MLIDMDPDSHSCGRRSSPRSVGCVTVPGGGTPPGDRPGTCGGTASRVPVVADEDEIHAVGAPGARRRAAALCAVEGLVLAGLAAFYGYEIAIGESDSIARAVMSLLLILVGAAALLLMARGWAGGSTWPRTPTIVWNALLVPVAWSLLQSGRPLIALGVAVLAVGSVLSAVSASPGGRAAPDA